MLYILYTFHMIIIGQLTLILIWNSYIIFVTGVILYSSVLLIIILKGGGGGGGGGGVSP